MTTLGIDISHWQAEPLPWAAWRDRVSVVGIKLTDGSSPDWLAGAHLAAAKAAGYTRLFGYHYLEPMSGSAQADNFRARLSAAFTFAVLDVEEMGLSEPVMRAFCDNYDAHETRPLVLYGNGNLLAPLIAQNPARYAQYGIWWAEYGPNLPTSTPPYASPHTPAGLRIVAWQFTGKGQLAPYPNRIDLTIWYSVPGTATVPPPADTLAADIARHAEAIKRLVV
jgi:GH25 family lysozyme M1 (1,4-beta-N-acetylmuramidase)